jgi:ribosomal protein S18 acetylase RimI-like enzyme
VPTDFIARPATYADVSVLGELSRAVDVGWWGKPETEDSDVRHGLEWARNLEARTRVLLQGERVVAFASVLGHGESFLSVHPGADEQVRNDAYDDLVPWLASVGSREVESPRQDAERLTALARHGLMPERSSFELERPASDPLPEPVWPAGVAAEPFDLDRDAEAVHALIYSAWTDVPGHHMRAYDEWRLLFTGYDSFDPKLQVVATRDGKPVGVALCRVFGGTDGWVSQLMVGREARGEGLGRALLLEALRRLVTTGVDLVGLSVMARNDHALGLYRRVGLHVEREIVICTATASDELAGEGAGEAPGVAPDPAFPALP